jgi:demethylmenaquinone methyltransferase/2-methoxy-6-polyprenyl-1,4-benzoquinol methylase
VRPVLARPDARVLDLCCGTGDLLIALERAAGRPAAGADFCHPMLEGARRKVGAQGLRSAVVEADALALPVADGTLDLITTAFGFRNLSNYDRGLREMRRALKPGGVAAILEFSTPPNRMVNALYGFYSRRILPVIGSALSGDSGAYDYLPESVRKFPGAEELAERMRQAGFGDVHFERMTMGIVALHTGTAE